MRLLLLILTFALAAPLQVQPVERTLKNPSDRAHDPQPLKLPIRLDVPFDSTRLKVTEDGRAIVHQVDIHQGSPTAVMAGDVWVRTGLDRGASRTYQVLRNVDPLAAENPFTVVHNREGFLISNGRVEVKLPPETTAPDRPPGPILGMRRAGGKWVTSSLWRSSVRCLMLQPRIVSRGPLFAQVELLYFFADPSYEGRIPFAAVTVRINAGESIVRITESHDMYEGDHWLLNLSEGIAPLRFQAIDHEGLTRDVDVKGAADSLPSLAPRSSNIPAAHAAIVATGTDDLLAIAPDAGPWDRPKDNVIHLRPAEKGGATLLDLGTWRGDRAWVMYLGAPPESLRVGPLLRSATTESLNHLINPPPAK